MAARDDDNPPGTEHTELIPLDSLLLDVENARFGPAGTAGWDQADALDHIVNTFGVDDVLSSIAINGYMSTEPIVCRRDVDTGAVTVVEGNRRLTACLIIAGEPRAARQKTRTTRYRKIWSEHGSKTIDPLPAIVFTDSDRAGALLSYLGVRHIASAQPWDSYAKAAWVARVVGENTLPLADVALMIGDQHQTVKRLLEGYYFIEQAIASGEFQPENSVRRGRGSVTDYPFSWVYTLLGYSGTREFLGLGGKEPKKDFVKKEKLRDAGLVLKAMFGDKSKGRNAAIEDSREIGELARVLGSPENVDLLRAGKSVAEIGRLTKPIGDRIREGLTNVRTIQGEIVAGLSEQPLDAEIAEGLTKPAGMNRRTAADIEKRIESAARGQTE